MRSIKGLATLVLSVALGCAAVAMMATPAAAYSSNTTGEHGRVTVFQAPAGQPGLWADGYMSIDGPDVARTAAPAGSQDITVTYSIRQETTCNDYLSCGDRYGKPTWTDVGHVSQTISVPPDHFARFGGAKWTKPSNESGPFRADLVISWKSGSSSLGSQNVSYTDADDYHCDEGCHTIRATDNQWSVQYDNVG